VKICQTQRGDAIRKNELRFHMTHMAVRRFCRLKFHKEAPAARITHAQQNLNTLQKEKL
jgi:hypothetical protein